MTLYSTFLLVNNKLNMQCFSFYCFLGVALLFFLMLSLFFGGCFTVIIICLVQYFSNLSTVLALQQHSLSPCAIYGIDDVWSAPITHILSWPNIVGLYGGHYSLSTS